MRKTSSKRYDFSILKPLLEEIGYLVNYLSGCGLEARRFPYHFIFYNKDCSTDVNFHLDRNRIPNHHMVRTKKTSRILLSEYRKIVNRYKLKLKVHV